MSVDVEFIAKTDYQQENKQTTTTSPPLDDPNTNEFLTDDWETTELPVPVPVTDQATAPAEPPATATPPENSPNNHEPAIEALRWVGEYPKYEYDPNAEPLYVRTRCYAPQLQRFCSP